MIHTYTGSIAQGKKIEASKWNKRKQVKRMAAAGATLLGIVLIILLVSASFGQTDVYAADTKPIEHRTIIVEYGDTLWGIASDYSTGQFGIKEYIYKLKKLNGLKDSSIKAGQKLILPD
ncbi:LysM peptidoglycan-binding domain-containing protein [Paenibacillus sp. YYML68]|uniref:LysM peptidoglycan-binding domain-containing protein n=1 Tax=Paenibacillus sp. YYML68 TaxID=2909250 RepID=UPI002493492A|nr:LysM peptidoglycan-binding domain-containing protein [Paenibacillus sp. YYML68]